MQPDAKTLDRLANTHAAHFTVGLARHPPAHNANNCFGSGILVRYHNVAGLLTCAHVVEAALSQSSIALIVHSVRDGIKQSITLDFRSLQSEWFRGDGPENEGPDLAFVRLPAITMSAMEAHGSTLNLSRQKERYKKPLESHYLMEAFSGSINEWMGQPEEKETHTELENNILLIGGKISALKPSSGFDRLLFAPGPGSAQAPASAPIPPKSFEGMSGGGIWRLGIRDDKTGDFSVDDRRLVGIAFYQTEERTIIGHGPKSIYENLLPEIAKWDE